MMHRLPKATEVEVNRSLEKFLETERIDDLIPNYQGINVSPGEQVCLNRCISKLDNVRELVDKKIMKPLELSPQVMVEMPPILYNQNLP